MFTAAARALAQMFTPPMRGILWKSIGFALVLIVAFGILLQRLLVWLAGNGELWAQGALGPSSQTPLHVLFWGAGGSIVGQMAWPPEVPSKARL